MPSEVLTSRLEREIFFRSFVRGLRPPPSVAKAIIDYMREELHPPGSVIYRRGEPADFIHYMVRGEIELRAPDKTPWIFEGRSILGALDAFQEQAYSRTAVATGETLLLKVPMEEYFDLMADNFDFAKSMLNVLFGGLDELSRALPATVAYPYENRMPAILSPDATMGLVERVMVLRAARTLQRIRLQVLVRLAQQAEERRFSSGESVWSKGEIPDAFWVVAAGSVRLEREVKSGPDFVDFLPGSVVGSIAAFGGREADYQARTTSPSLLLSVYKDDFFDVMEDHAELARAVLAFAAAERSRMQTILAGDAPAPPTPPTVGALSA